MKKDIYALKEIIFHNYKVYVPANPEAITVYVYGPNWYLPKSKSDMDYYPSWGNNPRQLKN
ncbi:MAG: hypothetical protein Barrevirus42_3 [Barrevirus sp.]|uniref:Uncharacterized protein n=1 Tax=Barrevirus sp. TaxID=2487763 RepID=A0A3G4ZR23_9VIRU|nr:MAG: hypothetical protein Barrevirus42_3 [Barrevirus sp.]